MAGGPHLALLLSDRDSFEIPSQGQVGEVTCGVPPDKCGDQNDDGVVDVLDVVIDMQIMLELVVPTDSQKKLSDLNRDGAINVFDAILGLQRIVGLVPALEDCGPVTP